MLLGVSQTPLWLVTLPAVAALLGVVVGQLLPEFFRQRAEARERYDSAVAAVTNAYAARHGVGLEVPREWLKAPDEEQHALTEHELSKAAMERFLDANAAARSALASLYPWSPDLRSFWDRPMLNEDDFEAVLTILTERRKSPRRRYNASLIYD
jgi:hypothetical protein